MITEDLGYYNGIHFTIETIGPEEAKNIVENHNNLNRRVNKAHVKAIANNMKNGTWRFNGDSLRFNKNDELIDGQHRLYAVIEYNNSVVFLVERGFTEDTIRTIDQEIKPRNLSDLLKMNDVSSPNDVASVINRYFIIKDTNAPFMTNSRDSSSANGNFFRITTIDDKFNEYMNNIDFYDEIILYGRRCYKKTHLLKVSEIGGIYAFLYKQKHHSDEEIQGFFDRLCLNSNIDVTVINTLRNKLIEDKGSRNPMTSSLKSAYITKAWNYYIIKKEVKILSYNKNTEGIIEFI